MFKQNKRSKVEITREETNSKLEFDVVVKTVTLADGTKMEFPVKVIKPDASKVEEPLGVRSTVSFGR